ncbi:MAG: hypothetical protein AAGG01_23225, partial [Planctomycetota bacterium]
MVGLVELGLYLKRSPELKRSPDGGHMHYVGDDPDLGYAAKPLAEGAASLELGNELIYSTVYAFDGSGRRITSGAPDGASTSVLCFGGSYMLGEGLAQEETLPSQLQKLWSQRSAEAEMLRSPVALNYGLHGWGPHQMLALIRSGRAPGPSDPPPVAALYWAIE